LVNGITSFCFFAFGFFVNILEAPAFSQARLVLEFDHLIHFEFFKQKIVSLNFLEYLKNKIKKVFKIKE